MPSSVAELQARLPGLMLRDRHRLQRRLEGARGRAATGLSEHAATELAGEVAAAERRVAARRTGVPAITYPEQLPVARRKDDILAALRDAQVVVVAGETGSGKTTQLPKICLELGRGVQGMIGHTQPRRIAARTVADRVAEELGTPLGEAVGYQVRFTDRVSDRTLVKVMTDGVLLAEIQRDRMLHRYDTLIIDEAHERSLNVDFLLGYLKQLLPRRPDLKVVITSATLDPERFSRHFDGAPIVEVSGRTYPVELRYRPLAPEVPDAEDTAGDLGSAAGRATGGAPGGQRPDVRDQTDAICDAVDELAAEGPGDVLVFLSGEREIRDTTDALRAHLQRAGGSRAALTEVLPLYARLSTAEQHKIFQPHTGRRIVLATNVAETSLTVPGIRYVVDPGTARISRYSHRTKVQRLPIEPVSRASADQRKGRCGRTSDGICIRLYSEQDFLARPEFTDPEILRTHLASVVLQMTALGLGDLAAFPFVDPPDRRSVADGVDLLHELGALEPVDARPARRGEVRPGVGHRLTPVGRSLAQLPVDPRLGRMVLEADRNGCLDEVLVIAAALSIQDPRERPVDQQQAAAQSHARFADETSDFLAYLNLWRYLRDRQRELSGNSFRRLCRAEFLHYLRIREWQDLHGQLRQVARRLGMGAGGGRTDADAADADRADEDTGAEVGAPAVDAQRVHVSLLAGLLSHVGLKDPEKQDFAGARGTRFAIAPGSALFRRPPRWVVAAELVETSRLWGRTAARIEPEWVEGLAGHLVKRTYSEPHWEKKQGAVVAYETVTLYGVPLVTGRKVGYGTVDPGLSRELFLRHALVEGDWDTHHTFFRRNAELVEEVRDLEDRVRRRNILVDDEVLVDFYDARVGPDVVSARHFDSWWKKTRRATPDLLDLPRSLLVSPAAGEVSPAQFPDAVRQGPLTFGLSYAFEPGAAVDGVTVRVPLAVLNQAGGGELDWPVPGLREELVTALIRSLPKPLRREVSPAPNYAKAVLERVTPGSGPLLDVLARELGRIARVTIPADAWALDRVPAHLLPTYRVEDGAGRVLAEGKDLAELRHRLTDEVRATLAATDPGIERSGLRSWSIGTLPRTVEREWGGHRVKAHPALVDEGGTVAVRLLETEAEQRRAMEQGTRRLLLLGTPSPVRAVQSRLGNAAKLVLSRNPHGSVAALLEDCTTCAVDAIVAEHGGPAWDAEGFDGLLAAVRPGLADAVLDVVGTVERILALTYDLVMALRAVNGPAPSVHDVRGQLSGLVHAGFVAETGRRRLPHVLRYLRAAQRRVEKLTDNPARDLRGVRRVEQMRQAHTEWLAALAPAVRSTEAAREVRWMIEELRVSLFAQELGTAYRVSEERIYRAMDDLTG